MNYVLCKNPNLRLDMMVDEQFAPQLVGYIQRMGCTYDREAVVTPRKGRVYRVLKDIQGPTGAAVGELIGLFYALEWGSLMEGENARKFYLMINPRRKERKKHAGTNRKETDQGSNRGNRGEPAGNPGPEPLGGPAGDGIDPGAIGADDLWELPRVE